jgi:putative membrane protein
MVTDENVKTAIEPQAVLEHQKVLIYRHMAWLTSLRFAMRQKRTWETFLEHKTNREWYDFMHIPERDSNMEDELQKLLSPDEFERVMGKTNKAAAILTLQSSHLRKLKEAGLVWEFSFLELESVLARLFEHQGKSERIKNFPYPRQFATLGLDLVNAFVLLLPFGVIPEFSKIGQQLQVDHSIVGPYFIWLSIPFASIVSWIFHTMQRIGIVGENPFEGSANDVPISSIARGIEIDLREMIDEEKELIPDQIPITRHVQM